MAEPIEQNQPQDENSENQPQPLSQRNPHWHAYLTLTDAILRKDGFSFIELEQKRRSDSFLYERYHNKAGDKAWDILDRGGFGIQRVGTGISITLTRLGPLSCGIGSPCFFKLAMYPEIASFTIYIASSRVSPSVKHPGRAGTETTYPPSSAGSKIAVYLKTFLEIFFAIYSNFKQLHLTLQADLVILRYGKSNTRKVWDIWSLR